MAFHDNDDLRRALDALTVFDVWDRAFKAGAVLTGAPAQRRDGQYPSPFREDGKRGSFSICHDGKGYRDFGGDGVSGGVWKFHELCFPNMEKRDRAKELIAWSGIVPTPAPAPKTASPAAPAQPGAAAPVDPTLAAAAASIAKRNRLREMEEAAYEARDRLLDAPPPKAVPACPAFILDHYNEGIAHCREKTSRVRDLARERGWPEAWVHSLLDKQLLSYPWERWARPGERWAGRQKAFAVQIPRAQPGGAVALEMVGYHQRFYEPAAGGRPENKGWLYVPSLPKKGARSELERQLEQYGTELGLSWNLSKSPPALVPPLPFVVGDVENASLAVLLEGQWDAITFFGACGWFFEDEWVDPLAPEGCVVFGIRGAQGMDGFLSYWTPWLQRRRPRVWAIADNDAAGGAWREQPPAHVGLPRPPSFADRIYHACGGREKMGDRVPIVSWLKPGKWGKDFNDYYRARAASGSPLGPGQMRKWMQAQGVLSADGRWL